MYFSVKVDFIVSYVHADAVENSQGSIGMRQH